MTVEGMKYQAKNHIVFIIIMVVYIGLSACSNKEEVAKVEGVETEMVNFVTNDTFYLVKNQISTLEKELERINQGIKHLEDELIRFSTEIKVTRTDLNDFIESDVNSINKVNGVISRINTVESAIERIEKKFKSSKGLKSSKNKKNKLVFNYRIVDVGQWGDRVFVSVKVKGEFVFLTLGDVVGIWRLENADIQTREVIFKHQTMQKTVSRVVL